MIKITKEETIDHTIIKCVGHANYSKYGQDIVCSAISALTMTLIYSLEELTKNKMDTIVDSGYIQITIYKKTIKSRLLIDSFFVGAKEISHVYKDYVKVL